MIKVLMISTVELGKNGISTFILNNFKLIASDDIIIDIIAPNRVSDDIKKEITNKKMNLYELIDRKSNTMQYIKKLNKLLSCNKYDIVHVHGNSSTMVIELILSKFNNCKATIAHSHNTTCSHKAINNILYPIFLKTCDIRLACGIAAGNWLYRKNTFKVIKNGILLKRYKPNYTIRQEIRKKLNIDSDTLVIGHVGGFVYQKNQEFFIELMMLLKKRKQKKVKVVLIGDGPEYEQYKKTLIDNNLKNEFILTGNIDNVCDYLQAIDLFLLPSRFEGLPYVLIEAQASNLKCLVSNNVSKEVDITNSISFFSLENIEEWIKFIDNQNIKKLWKDRLENYDENIKNIILNGYDLISNSDSLRNIYINYEYYKKVK